MLNKCQIFCGHSLLTPCLSLNNINRSVTSELFDVSDSILNLINWSIICSIGVLVYGVSSNKQFITSSFVSLLSFVRVYLVHRESYLIFITNLVIENGCKLALLIVIRIKLFLLVRFHFLVIHQPLSAQSDRIRVFPYHKTNSELLQWVWCQCVNVKDACCASLTMIELWTNRARITPFNLDALRSTLDHAIWILWRISKLIQFHLKSHFAVTLLSKVFWEFDHADRYSVFSLISSESVVTDLRRTNLWLSVDWASILIHYSTVESDPVRWLFVQLVICIELCCLVKIGGNKWNISSLNFFHHVLLLIFSTTIILSARSSSFKGLVFDSDVFVVVRLVQNNGGLSLLDLLDFISFFKSNGINRYTGSLSLSLLYDHFAHCWLSIQFSILHEYGKLFK